MKTIANLRTPENEEAYKDVKNSLEDLLFSQMYGISGAIHKAISLTWVMPETEKREAVREKLYKLSDEVSNLLDEEFDDYQTTEFENKA